MSDTKGLHELIKQLNHQINFIQMCIDSLEERVTELEQHITNEYEIEADFELE